MKTSTRIQSQLLATKFYIPVALGRLISRPRLSALLDKGLNHPVTLVSAAAGFGKTTFLSSWARSLQARDARRCWVSLDEEDNDPRLFWSYVLTALQMHCPERFEPLLMHLQSQSPPPIKSLLTALMVSSDKWMPFASLKKASVSSVVQRNCSVRISSMRWSACCSGNVGSARVARMICK